MAVARCTLPGAVRARAGARTARRAARVTRRAGGDDAKFEESPTLEQFAASDYPSRTELTGGWAGGEKGLWELREAEKAKQSVAAPVSAVTGEAEAGGAQEPQYADLSKDFGGLVGGFPGGEVGLKGFVKSGTLAKPVEASVGWGPFVAAFFGAVVFAIALISGAADPKEFAEWLDGDVPSIEVPASSVQSFEKDLLSLYVAFGTVLSYAFIQEPGEDTAVAAAGKAARVAAVGLPAVAASLKVLDLI